MTRTKVFLGGMILGALLLKAAQEGRMRYTVNKMKAQWMEEWTSRSNGGQTLRDAEFFGNWSSGEHGHMSEDTAEAIALHSAAEGEDVTVLLTDDTVNLPKVVKREHPLPD